MATNALGGLGISMDRMASDGQNQNCA